MMQQEPRDPFMSRRESLWRLGGGIGGVALAYLLDADRLLAATATGDSSSNRRDGGPMPHHPPKARRIVQLFLNGGMSQMDTFDHKPELERRHGEKFDPGEGIRVEAATSAPGNLMKCPFEFRQYGDCGRWVSSVFPHLSRCVDQMAFLMALSSKTNVHGPASYMMNTGFILPGFPCMGAWISYGLGRLCDNLPTFVVLPDARGFPYNQQGNFTSAFLPVTHQGTVIQASSASPIPDLFPAKPRDFASGASPADTLDVLARLNRRHAAANTGDTRLESRIESYELAARMQLAAPEALDLGQETEATRRMYGLEEKATEDFGRRCLL